MASGSAPSSEQRPSSEAEKGDDGVRIGEKTAGMNLHSHPGFGHCEVCVVCGNRACNHHYYGVASCHGCKCFFWRSIKNKMKYICRGDGECVINSNHRNACRYCRLQRCLKAGMQPDAVRVPKLATETEMELAELEKVLGKKQQRDHKQDVKMSVEGNCPLCHQQQSRDGKLQKLTGATKIDGDKLVETVAVENPQMQLTQSQHLFQQLDNALEQQSQLLLVRKLILIEMDVNEVADFSENEAPKRQLQLDSLFDYPESLDRFRTQINYCVRLRRVTEEELEFCKYRSLTKVVDYIRALASLDPNNLMSTEGGDQLTVQDKILLLRHGFAPLVLFDIAAGTSFATKDTQSLLCLPTGLTVCAGEPIVPNNFLSQQIVSRCIGSLVRLLTELQLDQEEFVLMKLIILALALDSANDEAGDTNPLEGLEQNEIYPSAVALTPFYAVTRRMDTGPLLSPSAHQLVDQLRDWAHAALYRHSPKKYISSATMPGSSSAVSSSSDAALRFAKLLHILPKLTLLSRDLIEHIRMVHTFPTTRCRPTDPLFFQLFGDIFHESQQSRSMANGGNLFSAADLNSPFGSPQPTMDALQQKGCFEQQLTVTTTGGPMANAKMISPSEPYQKVEYGGSAKAPIRPETNYEHLSAMNPNCIFILIKLILIIFHFRTFDN